MWEAAAQKFGSIGGHMEIDKRCPQPLVFDGSILGEYFCTIVQNKDGDWELALQTGVSQRRCRVIFKRPW